MYKSLVILHSVADSVIIQCERITIHGCLARLDATRYEQRSRRHRGGGVWGIPPQPTIGGFGSVVSSPSGPRAEFRLKTILVLSNRDRMPLVAHFTHFESDTEGIGNTTELCIIDFVRLRNELTKSYCRKTNGARASVSHSWQCQ